LNSFHVDVEKAPLLGQALDNNKKVEQVGAGDADEAI